MCGFFLSGEICAFGDGTVAREQSQQWFSFYLGIYGYKELADDIIANSEEEPAEGSYVVMNYPVTEAEDITVFKNLRVLRTFDLAEVSSMQEGCYYTQLYNAYGMGTTAVPFESLIEGAALTDLKKLDQLSSLTNLEQVSLQYTGITNLEGIEKFENLTKLDIGNTLVTDFEPLSKLTSLTDLTMVQMGDRTATETETSESEDEDKEEELFGQFLPSCFAPR